MGGLNNILIFEAHGNFLCVLSGTGSKAVWHLFYSVTMVILAEGWA